MSGTNVLFGQIAVVFGIVIAGVWSATQWTADALGYQIRLGSPWFDFSGTPVYYPWKLFEWWFVFDAYAPRIFNIGGMIAGGSGFVAVLVAIAMSIWRSRQSRLVTTYGSARVRTGKSPQAGVRGFRTACCSIRPMSSRQPTTRYWKCGMRRMKCAMCKTLPTFWLT